MQRNTFTWIICVIVTYCGTLCWANVETVLRQVGENATLECPELVSGEIHGSGMWRHNGQLLATMSTSGQIAVADSSIKDLVTIESDMTLVIPLVSKEVKGTFVCSMDVTVKGNVSTKYNEFDLLVQAVPDRPKKPKVNNVTSSQGVVSWEAPDSNNSPITSYQLDVRECGEVQAVKTDTAASDARVQTVDGLNPYTCYKVSVTAINAIGNSLRSLPSDDFYTEQDVNMTTPATTSPPIPTSVPGNFLAIPDTNEIQLKWDKPKRKWSGEIVGYEIKYGKSADSMTTFKVKDPDSTQTTLVGLDPYTMYTISIRVYNLVGKGPETATTVQTKEGVPEMPRITHINNNKATSFYVHWESPKVTNGKITKYKVQWREETSSTNKSREIVGHLTNPMTAFINDLKPYLGYKVQVAAYTAAGYGQFTPEYPALTEVTAPSAPQNLTLTLKSPTAIHLKWDRPKTVHRRVDNYLVYLWDHRGDDVKETIPGHLNEYTMPRLTTDSRYYVKLAGITKAVFSNASLRGDFCQPIRFVLGDTGGPRTAMTHIRDNGNETALAFDYGKVISIVDGSGVDGDYGIEDATNNHNNELGRRAESDDESLSGVVIAAIVCVVLIVVVVVAVLIGYRFFVCRRCYLAAYLYLAVPSNGNSVPQTNIRVEEPSEEKQYPDIPINDFISHVDLMHMDSDIAFAQEFDEINRASNTDKYSCENSNGTDNRMKNRYINIVAYDHSRVVLKTDMGRPKQSDYINANYVDGYKKPKAYIATQGPLPSTFPDFWRMVWEQNTTVIVMITNLMEKGRRKCDQYWPNDGTESYGNIQVKLTNTVPRAHYTVRIFTLKNLKVKKRHSMKGTSERTVYHYHYTEWPDHGVPDYSLPVLDFVQKSAAHSGPVAGPIVVHCSAGVGRTGTYILIDSMIAQIQDRQCVNIPGFTQFIRRQRNYLVQTEDQYIFIHSVLVEYLLGGGATEVKEEFLTDYLSQLEQPPTDQLLQSVTDTSLLTKQFQLITSYHPSEADQYAAHRACNVDKNRVGSLHPVNLKRVLLPARPGVEGSDYINASYLQGYERSGEFVVTQHPTDETVEDFWRMVWDRNSTVIVVLSPIDEKFKEFWPALDNSTEIDAGNFRLAMKEGPVDDNNQGFTTYEFILDSIQYDYTLMTRIICVKDWPTSCVELHRVFDVIVTARNYINSTECGPVVVMDQFGGTAAGTFCALWTLRDQLFSEKCVDFYQLAKLYHYKRPGILGTEDDYFFLHKAIAALARHMNDTSTSSSNNPHHHYHHHHYVNINNHNTNHNHNNHHHQNGTLPRAANASSHPAGLPRSSTIASGGGDGSSSSSTSPATIATTDNTGVSTASDTTNSSAKSPDEDNKDKDEGQEKDTIAAIDVDTNRTSTIEMGEGEEGMEAAFLNQINNRNSYINADTGEAKLETNI